MPVFSISRIAFLFAILQPTFGVLDQPARQTNITEEENVVASPHSTVLLSCSSDPERRFLITEDDFDDDRANVTESWLSTTTSRQRRFCYFGEDGSLNLAIRHVQPSDAANYICIPPNTTHNSSKIRFVVSVDPRVSFERAPTKGAFNPLSTEESEEVCENKTKQIEGSTVVWKSRGEIVCDQAVQCPRNDELDPTAENESSSWSILAPICTISMALLLVNLLVFGFVYMRRRTAELKKLSELHSELIFKQEVPQVRDSPTFPRPLHQQIDLLPYDVNYEISLHRLTIRKVISSGEYGRVYLGELRGKGLSRETMRVHVKGPKRKANYHDVKALADELKMLMAVGAHPNVLALIGTVAENMQRGGDLYGIMEDTIIDLKTFLTKQKTFFINELENATPDASPAPTRRGSSKRDKLKKTLGPSISTSVLNSFSYQIANGMEYLTSKMCVHRDLAARNVLLRKNRVIRIMGFEQDRQWDYQYLFKSIQYASPFKAMARESIGVESTFTEKSDVWSYGVLLWEIYTLGEDPFKDFETPQKLAAFYETGGRLSAPIYMPTKIGELMSNCWKEDPNMRPTFTTCKRITERHLRDTNPRLLIWLVDQLKEEMSTMQQYSAWRDGVSPHLLRNSRSISSDCP